ncbi:hypothetical protein KDH83_18485 [Achromobacter sp. Marseille-Q0513]|uniref:hypothetical protein n=1 Tax=Achromobacter sp. Marseille-Q0513 TaxID=2829161 RepID=UPI001BA127FC|nr:hypothetical protein [Achromobacter sp. Marseille-Q0513]MBR8655295.1 hypothetical protein [Achromobacter sp. Marseille-Q0513]
MGTSEIPKKFWLERWLGPYWVTLALSPPIGALLVWAAFYGTVSCCSTVRPGQAWMVLAVGAVLGWGSAILVAPYTAEDERNFNRVARLFAAFAGGFSLAKVSEWLFAVKLEHLTEPRLMLLGLGVVSFAVFAILTYTFRVYGIPFEPDGGPAGSCAPPNTAPALLPQSGYSRGTVKGDQPSAARELN